MRKYGSVCAMAICCVHLLLCEQCTVNDVYTQTIQKQHILTNFYYFDSMIWNRLQWIRYSGMNIPKVAFPYLT